MVEALVVVAVVVLLEALVVLGSGTLVVAVKGGATPIEPIEVCTSSSQSLEIGREDEATARLEETPLPLDGTGVAVTMTAVRVAEHARVTVLVWVTVTTLALAQLATAEDPELDARDIAFEASKYMTDSQKGIMNI